MAKKKTHEEYANELAIKNPNIEVIGRYVNAQTLILHKCLIDNYKWLAKPNNILSGKGCPKCAGVLKKTHKEYVDELSAINKDIEIVDTYINAKTPILHKCKRHNVEWKASPTNILNGDGCPRCKGERIKNKLSKTHEEYIKEVFRINQNIEVLEEYINAKTQILHRCKIDNYIWKVEPDHILNGRGCPKCANNIRKTQEEYISEVNILNPDIDVVDEYINAKTPIFHKCKIHNYIWNIAPYNVLNGVGCPICHESSGERLTRRYLEKNDIRYELQYIFKNCIDINPLPFDFYLPDYNIAIEYQGEQHYRSVDFFGGEEKFKIQQKHDNIKREYCNNNNIRLLEIPYFKNVEEELNNFLFI